jgi:dynein heavy chain 1
MLQSSSLSILRQALEQTTGRKISTYTIDPKALSKEDLYGSLDSTTLEWVDGVFTGLLRKILDNYGVANASPSSEDAFSSRIIQRNEQWLIFDGDVDPNWCENLNSVLDDNKILTLPNGERLALTPNIRIIFECQNLDYATPATVSRWYVQITQAARRRHVRILRVKRGMRQWSSLICFLLFILGCVCSVACCGTRLVW